MTAIARFEIVPVRQGSMAQPIARTLEALDRFDVAYVTTPTDTVIEAQTLDELFAAIQAAHEALLDEQRIVTELEIDFQPGRPQGMDDRVRAVERELGRPPRSEEPRPSSRAPAQGGSQRGQQYGQPQAPTQGAPGGTGRGQGGLRPESTQGRRYGTRRF